MTYKEFIRSLRKLKGKYEIVELSKEIRAIDEKIGYCPIVGVAKYYGAPSDSYEYGATHLGLPKTYRDKIVDAADDCETRYKAIRRDLLRALGLKEK